MRGNNEGVSNQIDNGFRGFHGILLLLIISRCISVKSAKSVVEENYKCFDTPSSGLCNSVTVLVSPIWAVAEPSAACWQQVLRFVQAAVQVVAAEAYFL